MASKLENKRMLLEKDLYDIICKPSSWQKKKAEVKSIQRKMETFLKNVEAQFRFQEEIVRVILVESIEKFPISDCIEEFPLSDCITEDLKSLSECFYIVFVYCVNLLIHEVRTEFHTIATYSGTWQTLMGKYLQGGERLLQALGYEYSEQHSHFEWHIDTYAAHRVRQLVFECLLASVECLVILEIYQYVVPHDYTIRQVCVCRQEHNEHPHDLAQYMFETIAAENASVALNKSKLTVASFSQLERKELTKSFEESNRLMEAQSVAPVTFDLNTYDIIESAEADAINAERKIKDPAHSKVKVDPSIGSLKTSDSKHSKTREKGKVTVADRIAGNSKSSSLKRENRRVNTLPEASRAGPVTRSRSGGAYNTGDFTCAANMQVKLPPSSDMKERIKDIEQPARKPSSTIGNSKGNRLLPSCLTSQDKGDECNYPYQLMDTSPPCSPSQHPYYSKDNSADNRVPYADVVKLGSTRPPLDHAITAPPQDHDIVKISPTPPPAGHDGAKVSPNISPIDHDVAKISPITPPNSPTGRNMVKLSPTEQLTSYNEVKLSPTGPPPRHNVIVPATTAHYHSTSDGCGNYTNDRTHSLGTDMDNDSPAIISRSGMNNLENLMAELTIGDKGREDMAYAPATDYNTLTTGTRSDQRNYSSNTDTDSNYNRSSTVNYTDLYRSNVGSKSNHLALPPGLHVTTRITSTQTQPMNHKNYQMPDHEYAGFTSKHHQQLYIDQVCNNPSPSMGVSVESIPISSRYSLPSPLTQHTTYTSSGPTSHTTSPSISNHIYSQNESTYSSGASNLKSAGPPLATVEDMDDGNYTNMEENVKHRTVVNFPLSSHRSCGVSEDYSPLQNEIDSHRSSYVSGHKQCALCHSYDIVNDICLRCKSKRLQASL